MGRRVDDSNQSRMDWSGGNGVREGEGRGERRDGGRQPGYSLGIVNSDRRVMGMNILFGCHFSLWNLRVSTWRFRGH